MSETKTYVPWFARQEWEEVRNSLYSDDIERQKRGYEKLLVWKARVGQLPTGVECTIGFIQVHLQDERVLKQMSSGEIPAYAENDLRLMFSTAVMRFLNFVSTVAQADMSLYSMASELNIPEWLVTLRHDTAHNNDLPSLSILRLAVQFGLEWLHEHYWVESYKSLSDWVIQDVSFQDKSIDELIDIWQGLKMYEMDGYIYVHELIDKNLREYLDMLLSEKEVAPSSASDMPDNMDIEEENIVEEKKYRLTAARNVLIQKLLKVVHNEKRKNKQGVMENLVALLVNSESFIPPENLANELSEKASEKLNGNNLPKWIRALWQELLVVLQKSFAFFPLMVHRLLQLSCEEKDNHRQMFTALWIKEFCQSMRRSREVLTLMDQEQTEIMKALSNNFTNYKRRKLQKRIEESKIVSEVFEEVVSRVDDKCPELKNAIFVHLKNTTGTTCSLQDVKKAILNPHNYTNIFLSSLLDVAVPSIPPSTKGHLESLVAIYTKNNEISVEKSPIVFTVKDLAVSGEDFVDECEGSDLHQSHLEDTSHPVSDFVTGYDWSMCPLGILPWQQNILPVLDMPSEVTWKSCQPKVPEERTSFQHFVKRKVDWNKIKKTQSSIAKKSRERKRTIIKAIKRQQILKRRF